MTSAAPINLAPSGDSVSTSKASVFTSNSRFNLACLLWRHQLAEKIENVAFSCFSALIFLPTCLTNGRNSSNRELLSIHRMAVKTLSLNDFSQAETRSPLDGDSVCIYMPGTPRCGLNLR